MNLNQEHAFEFGKAFPVSNRTELEAYLKAVWEQFKSKHDIDDPVDESNKYQGFLSFDGNQARAKNFVGFIQGSELHIEIYPKVFNGKQIDTKGMLKHMFYWFDYCRKWKFPTTDIQLETLDYIDLPELIINLISNQILEVISSSPISLYEEIEEAMEVPKGRINFSRYLNNSLSKGNFHVLECDYEPLLFDNKLNRAIKYVARLLSKRAKFSETHRKLNEILFILDDVDDRPCTAQSLNEIKLNPFFTEYHSIIGLCKMILEQQVYSNDYDEQSHWSLLLPMEYIFEDFVAGFLEKHFSSEWKVEYQKSELYLTDERVFNMQHDVLLTHKESPNTKIIVDTKYKLRGNFKADKKRGIAQSDMYQITSYALKRGCNNVLLLYPNIDEKCLEPDIFAITSGFNNSGKIKVTAAEIPFWSKDNFSSITNTMKASLETLLKKIG